MAQKLIIYALLDPKTGKTVFKGNASDCAAFCGVSRDTIYSVTTKARYKGRTYKGYKVQVAGGHPEKNVVVRHEMAVAAKKWDEFCEPIRAEFGIPVYRTEKEGQS